MLGFSRQCPICGVIFAPGHSRRYECSLNCFLKSRIKIGKTESDCWIWRGARSRGYGIVQIERGQFQRAHRLVYEMLEGAIPAGKILCHRCDNPSCVNPQHMMVGTMADNTADMFSKGRQQDYSRNPKGETHHSAKVTEDAVRAIRASSAPSKMLAAQYGVNVWSIQNIRARRTWKHI